MVLIRDAILNFFSTVNLLYYKNSSVSLRWSVDRAKNFNVTPHQPANQVTQFNLRRHNRVSVCAFWFMDARAIHSGGIF